MADEEPVIPYASAEAAKLRNHVASIGLALGVLSVPVTLLAAIPGIIVSLRGLQKSKSLGGAGRKRAIAGIVLCSVNLLAFPFILRSSLRLRDEARQVACMSNLRQLGLATMAYASNNRGFLPPSTAELSEYLAGNPRLLACQSDPCRHFRASRRQRIKLPLCVCRTDTEAHPGSQPWQRGPGVRDRNQPPWGHGVRPVRRWACADDVTGRPCAASETNDHADRAAGKTLVPSLQHDFRAARQGVVAHNPIGRRDRGLARPLRDLHLAPPGRHLGRQCQRLIIQRRIHRRSQP